MKSAETATVVDLHRKLDLTACEQLLSRTLSQHSNNARYSVRLASQFGANFFADLWPAIVVATLCRDDFPPTHITTWGLDDWDRNSEFAKSIAGLTSLQIAPCVVTEKREGVDSTEVVQTISRRGRGVLENETGKTRTLLEFDPQQPIALRLDAPTSAQQSILFNNLIQTFRNDLEIGSRNRKFPVSSTGEIGILTRFLSELHENSYLYARSVISHGAPQKGLRIVRLKAHLATNRDDLIRRGDGFSPLRDYLEQIAYGPGAHGLMEASVSDFGDGILNHFLSSSRGKSYSDQPRPGLIRKLINENLSSSNNPSAGQGLPKVLKAAKSLSAFVSLRSNEFWLCKSFADSAATTELDNVNLPDLAPIAGTHWQFLWPMGI